MVPSELISSLLGNEFLDIVQFPGLPVIKESVGFTGSRVGFRRDHEFFEDGDVHRHLYLQDVLTGIGEVEARPRVSEFPCQVADCVQLFDTLESYEHHYNTLHRNVCFTCKRSFPSARILDVHILEWHDSLFQVMAEKSNMFQCLVEGCIAKFKTSGERKNHLIKSHLYPPDFRFDKPKKNKSKIKQECFKGKNQSMDVTPGDSSVVESMEGSFYNLLWPWICERIPTCKEKEMTALLKIESRKFTIPPI
ncbi:zinc finger protein 511 isoform X2 [Rhinoderma darwinii]|uniref:zinc finger protein 511 isoform X2 n=1 Tax=Rhinoderma darwinii TaxID=43563 RepID=UPI003F68037D